MAPKYGSVRPRMNQIAAAQESDLDDLWTVSNYLRVVFDDEDESLLEPARKKQFLDRYSLTRNGEKFREESIKNPAFEYSPRLLSPAFGSQKHGESSVEPGLTSKSQKNADSAAAEIANKDQISLKQSQDQFEPDRAQTSLKQVDISAVSVDSASGSVDSLLQSDSHAADRLSELSKTPADNDTYKPLPTSVPKFAETDALEKWRKSGIDPSSYLFEIRAYPLLRCVQSAHKATLTRDWVAAIREQKHILISDRIQELKKKEHWSLYQPYRQKEPPVQKTHYEYLLDELLWLEADFREERKWKIRVAKLLAEECKLWALENNLAREDRENDNMGASVSDAIASSTESAELDVKKPSAVEIKEDETKDDTIYDADLGDDLRTTPSFLSTIKDPEDFIVDEAGERTFSGLPLYSFAQSTASSDCRPASTFLGSLTPSTRLNGVSLVEEDKSVKRRRLSSLSKETVSGTESTYHRLSAHQHDEIDMFKRSTTMKTTKKQRQSHPTTLRSPAPPHISPAGPSYANAGTQASRAEKRSVWTPQEDALLLELLHNFQYNWDFVAQRLMPHDVLLSSEERRTAWDVFERWARIDPLVRSVTFTGPYARSAQQRISDIIKNNTGNLNHGSSEAAVRDTGNTLSIAYTHRRQRRRQRQYAMFEAFKKIARKRELAQKAGPPKKAVTNDSNKVAPTAVPTPSDLSKMKFEREQAIAAAAAQQRQAALAMHAAAHPRQMRPGTPGLAESATAVQSNHANLSNSSSVKSQGQLQHLQGMGGNSSAIGSSGGNSSAIGSSGGNSSPRLGHGLLSNTVNSANAVSGGPGVGRPLRPSLASFAGLRPHTTSEQQIQYNLLLQQRQNLLRQNLTTIRGTKVSHTPNQNQQSHQQQKQPKQQDQSQQQHKSPSQQHQSPSLSSLTPQSLPAIGSPQTKASSPASVVQAAIQASQHRPASSSPKLQQHSPQLQQRQSLSPQSLRQLPLAQQLPSILQNSQIQSSDRIDLQQQQQQFAHLIGSAAHLSPKEVAEMVQRSYPQLPTQTALQIAQAIAPKR